MQERTSLEDSLQGIGKVERELEDNVGMIELGEAENDPGVVTEAEAASSGGMSVSPDSAAVPVRPGTGGLY